MKKSTKEKILLTCGTAALAAGAVCWCRWSNRALVTTNYTIRSGKLPEAFNAFRITQVSDLQSDYFGAGQSQLLVSVRKTKPDIIVITGDLVDRNHTNFMAAMKAVSGLLKIAPVYYVNGNHELSLLASELADFYRKMEDMGVRLLMNERADIPLMGPAGNRDGGCGEKPIDALAGPQTAEAGKAPEPGKAAAGKEPSVSLIGLDEKEVFESRGQPYGHGFKERGGELDPVFFCERLEGLYQKADPENFTILLAHEPQLMELYQDPRIDLVLSGHAHGGQFRLPGGRGLYAPGQGIFPKYTSGMHSFGESRLIVSRGLGNSVFPLRLNDPPELVTIDLYGKTNVERER